MAVMGQALSKDKQLSFVGQKTDLEHYSKLYWLLMEGMKQCTTE